MKTSVLADLKDQIVKRISENRISSGTGTRGTVTISLAYGAGRTFKAHWSGFRIMFPGQVIILRAELNDATFWTEGYISMEQPSWVLAFRKQPHKDRGTGGPRPDDKFAPESSYQASYAFRKGLLDKGVIQQEELIRMEDSDHAEEAIDQFFNYCSFYVLKAVGATWSDFGYVADPSIGWGADHEHSASLPIEAAIDEGLKRSDIIWVGLDTNTPVPCWFLYTKDKRLFVLSAEPQQRLPNHDRARNARVTTRWKGRDAAMTEFEASVRVIDASQSQEFREIGELLVNKRQSVIGTAEENITRWMTDGVILELIPRS
ncbi:MAG: hypothetical protein ABIS18_11050 [Actinomycetota bacterium]